MNKYYKDLLDNVDDLMISLRKQKNLGLDAEVVEALKRFAKSRNMFKKHLITQAIPVKLKQLKEKVNYIPFLDAVANSVK